MRGPLSWPGAGGGEEPAALRPEGTVLSDLSANVFAALLLILVVLLQLRLAADRAEPAPRRPVEAGSDLGAVAHRPLRPGDLVALLRMRVSGAPGLALDVGRDGLTLVEDGRATALSGPAALDGLAAAAQGTPVRLYVFSNRLFGGVAERLGRLGLAFEDLSVPQALRDPADPDRWSPAFLALAAAAGSPEAFRDGLTRLLVASDAPLSPEGRASGGRDALAGGGGAGEAASLGAQLLRWLGAALAAAALLAAAAVVAVTERLVARPGLGYASGGRSATGPTDDAA